MLILDREGSGPVLSPILIIFSDNTLYLLDEPENSMSPKMQIELAKILEDYARFFGCQFVIATHSPFLLALNGAKIYNLDSTPVSICDWWELENTRMYYEFFKKHERLFEAAAKKSD